MEIENPVESGNSEMDVSHPSSLCLICVSFFDETIFKIG